MQYEPIVCYECGGPISDKWDAFVALREIVVSVPDENEKKFIDPDLNQNLMPVFEALNIKRYCCREIFTTAQNIHNF